MQVKWLAAAFALVFAFAAQAQDAFAPLNFSVQPPVPAPGAPPTALQITPPLPFRYVGRLIQNGRAEVLILRGNTLHSVAEGDEIDGEYRVERITGATIQFTYLPAQAKQSLDLAAVTR